MRASRQRIGKIRWYWISKCFVNLQESGVKSGVKRQATGGPSRSQGGKMIFPGRVSLRQGGRRRKDWSEGNAVREGTYLERSS